MRSVCAALMLTATMLLASIPAQAGLITKPVSGSLTLPLGSPANMGSGSITGSVTYDDSVDFGLDPNTDLFALPQFNLGFSNGPTLTELDDPLAQIEVDVSTGDLVALTIFAVGLNGFGLTDLIFQTDFFSPTLFFSDNAGNVVVEGQVAFEGAAVPVPEPPPLALFGFAILGLATLHRRRGRFRS